MKTTSTQILPWLFVAAMFYLIQYAGYVLGMVLFNHWYWGVATAFGTNAILMGHFAAVWKNQ